MIKVVIAGADTPQAGELIRILAGHPEVTLCGAIADNLDGTQVSSKHHGLIGETDLVFRRSADLSRCDILFFCGEAPASSTIASLIDSYPDLRIVSFSSPEGGAKRLFTFGLPEIHRKELVRGAKYAYLPHPFSSLTLVALFPLASHLLLKEDIKIDVYAPEEIIKEADKSSIEAEIANELSEVQKGFTGKVTLNFIESPTRRTGLAEIHIPTDIRIDQILDMYNQYDDHRFSFAVLHPVGVSEVAGTNRCVISLTNDPDGKLKITSTADCRLRGGAGEAVHVMNLLFGLHEKTGLALKAIDFLPIDSKNQSEAQSSDQTDKYVD